MNAEEKSILEKAKQNLEAAELLLDQGFYEIAISRGYYALFYTAEALLLRRGLHFSSHSAVIAAYGREFAKTDELDPKFHQYLIKAQMFRLISDYGYSKTVPPISAEQVLMWGRQFVAAAEDFLK
jgi:uncharacterized protein (UPF0332 family)